MFTVHINPDSMTSTHLKIKRANNENLVTMPLPRSAKELKAVVQKQVNDGTKIVGKPIAPKHLV